MVWTLTDRLIKKRILRAFGAQDDRLARSAKKEKRETTLRCKIEYQGVEK